MTILTVAGTEAYTAYMERREVLGAAVEAATAAVRAARAENAHLTADERWEIVRPLHAAKEAAIAAFNANDEAFEAEGKAAEAAGVVWLTPSDDE